MLIPGLSRLDPMEGLQPNALKIYNHNKRNTNYKTILLKDKHVNNYIAVIQSKGKASMEDGPMKRRKGR